MQFFKVVPRHHQLITSAFQRQLTTCTTTIICQRLDLTGNKFTPKPIRNSYSTVEDGFFQKIKRIAGLGILSKTVSYKGHILFISFIYSFFLKYH